MQTHASLDKANDLLSGIGTRDCASWRSGILKHHQSVNLILAKQYEVTARKEGHASANRQLTRCHEELRLTGTNLYIHSSDEDIREFSRVKSRNVERQFRLRMQRVSFEHALVWLKNELLRANLVLPLAPNKTHCPEAQAQAAARAFSPRWWRRQLSTLAVRQLEQFMRVRGLVNSQRSPYVSPHGLRSRKVQNSRNRQLLKALEAISTEGDVVNLADAADASVSNPPVRRAELMVRLRGFEGIADALGLQGEFLTLTCPSKYHAFHKKGGRKNDKYNGATPREAQKYLNSIWARTRTAWHREGIQPFGFRVAEPHHDGTPHWHLLLFIPPDQCDKAWQIFLKYALAEDGDESGAKRQRAKRKTIDTTKGSAAGYLAKYISKNIDGFGIDHDIEAGTDAQDGAARVNAWAGIWGIRQFEQIGNTSVTVYREMRRIREALEDTQPEKLEQIRAAADAGNWAEFVNLMGGAFVSRAGQTLRAWMVQRERKNQYGEAVARIKGLIMQGVGKEVVRLITRRKTWKVQPSGTSAAVAATGPPGGPLDLCQ